MTKTFCFRNTFKPSKPFGTALCLALVPLVSLLIASCSQPPSWEKLLTDKITDQYPAYTVTQSVEGVLLVARPAQVTKRIDAKAIGEFCRRGPRDCNYAVDQALLELAPVKP